MSTSPYFHHVGVINKSAVIEAIASVRRELEIAASLEEKSVMDINVSGAMLLADLVNALEFSVDESYCALGIGILYQDGDGLVSNVSM